MELLCHLKVQEMQVARLEALGEPLSQGSGEIDGTAWLSAGWRAGLIFVCPSKRVQAILQPAWRTKEQDKFNARSVNCPMAILSTQICVYVPE